MCHCSNHHKKYILNLSEIISKCKARDREAEKVLFLHFAPRVLMLCRRYARQESDAQDMMQECFILVFDKIRQFNAEKGAFEAWLYKVCTNKVLQILRKQSKLRLVYVEQVPESVEEEPALFQLPREQILEALRQLPDGYRIIFNLYEIEDWSHKEIAAHLNISESASRSQLSRAKRQLQEILKPVLKKNKQQTKTFLAS